MNRVIVLGGAGRGIGAATAELLAAAGDVVVVLDAFSTEDSFYPLADTSDQAALDGITGVATVDVDLRDGSATRRAVDAVAAEHGHIDAVCSFAGAVAGGAPLWETDRAILARSLASNADVAWNLATAAIPHLLLRPATATPTFVAVTSVAGERGLYGLAPYVVAKHATVGVVRALAADLAGTAVTACGVAPGATDTRMLQETAAVYGINDPAELAQQQQRRVPLQPSDIARVVVHALSAGPVHHGGILPADGGFGRV